MMGRALASPPPHFDPPGIVDANPPPRTKKIDKITPCCTKNKLKKVEPKKSQPPKKKPTASKSAASKAASTKATAKATKAATARAHKCGNCHGKYNTGGAKAKAAAAGRRGRR